MHCGAGAAVGPCTTTFGATGGSYPHWPHRGHGCGDSRAPGAQASGARTRPAAVARRLPRAARKAVMSTALAIAGVTAVLRDLLNDGLINHNISGLLGSSVTVSVQAPDRVVTGSTPEASQLNLFMYMVTPNSAGATRVRQAATAAAARAWTNPPLASTCTICCRPARRRPARRDIAGYAHAAAARDAGADARGHTHLADPLTQRGQRPATGPARLGGFGPGRAGRADQDQSGHASSEEMSKFCTATQPPATPAPPIPPRWC